MRCCPRRHRRCRHHLRPPPSSNPRPLRQSSCSPQCPREFGGPDVFPQGYHCARVGIEASCGIGDVLLADHAARFTLESGKFEVLKESIGHLTTDPRLQALLIAFAFGAFIEGAAGFGTPVAVAAD